MVDHRDSTVRSLPSAFILGHSFVRRMNDFLRNNARNSPFNEHLDLKDTCAVRLFEYGGCTFEKLVPFDISTLKVDISTIFSLKAFNEK